MSEEESLLGILEKGVKDVLADVNSKPEDKLKAMEIGIKLLATKHKITPSGNKDNFFGGKQ